MHFIGALDSSVREKFATLMEPITKYLIDVCYDLSVLVPHPQFKYQLTALECIERNKATNLISHVTASKMAEDDPRMAQKIKLLMQDYTNIQLELKKKGLHPAEATSMTAELRKRYDTLVRKYLTRKSSSQFISTSNNNISGIMKILQPDTCVIYWYGRYRGECHYVFLITTAKVLMLPLNYDDIYLQICGIYLTALRELGPSHYGDKLADNNMIAQVTEALLQCGIDVATCELPSAVNYAAVLRYLGEKVVQWDTLVEHITDQCTKLCLIPQSMLHWFPLHTLTLKDKTRIMDNFENIFYAPSISAIIDRHAQGSDGGPVKSALVVASSLNLSWTNIESESVVDIFNRIGTGAMLKDVSLQQLRSLHPPLKLSNNIRNSNKTAVERSSTGHRLLTTDAAPANRKAPMI